MDEILRASRANLAPFYLQIKFLHLLSVMIWGLSTAVAYGWYVRVAHLGWQRDSDDADKRRRRDWAFEQFDRGVAMEHIAFPVLLLTGGVLLLIGGWPLEAEWSWLTLKLAIVVAIFIPMEWIDVRMAHGRGNLVKLRKAGETGAYAKSIEKHWRFLRITTPIVIVLVPLTIYLAVVKPF